MLCQIIIDIIAICLKTAAVLFFIYLAIVVIYHTTVELTEKRYKRKDAQNGKKH